jgi:putative addiction module CopG family antidote
VVVQLEFYNLLCYFKSMIVSLPPQLEAWVSSQVKMGSFADADQVLTEALKLLKMHVALEEQSALLVQDSKRREALQELVQQGQDLGMGY